MNNNKRVIALGFFDGVHRGHGALLETVVRKAEELGATASAFTFDRSPTAAITGQVVPLLSSVEDRAWLMRTCYGIQEVIVSSFDGMMRMDWRDFITQYLVKELGVVHVVAGHDFHFGYMGKGNPQRLQETCAQLGIGCDIIGKVELEDITISSTYIRTLIAQGEMDRARAHQPGHPREEDRQLLPGLPNGESPDSLPGDRPRLRGVRHPGLGGRTALYRRHQCGGAAHRGG